jgi:uncharacterized protein with von Willebrand factor type A (vWA) domain
MTQVLTNFIRALRATDVRVSTSESIDAAVTIDAVGFADRAILKESLSQVLAKSIDEKARFSHCFDRYFFVEDMAGVDTKDKEERGEDTEASPGDVDSPGAEQDGEGQGEGESNEAANGISGANRAELQMAVANAAREAGVENIRLFTQRGMFMRRILEIIGIEQLENEIREASDEDPARLNQTRAQLIEEVRAQVDRQLLLYTANAWPELREQILQKTPLSSVEVRDFKFMQGLVRKLAKRLVSLHSRKKKIARRGHLDVRQTIRRNIEYDGLLFETVWKRKKIDLFQDASAEDAISTALEKHGWGSTDYGRAFADLEEIVLDDIDHRTTVLILGDGRSNHGEPGLEHLRKIHERARRVIWINPEPRAFWNSGDSEMRRLSSACDRVDVCRSIQDLERLVSEIMRTAV